MKKLFNFMVCVAAILLSASCAKTYVSDSGVPYRIRRGVIETEVPDRAPGQESALQLACDPIPVVRIGVVGLGQRGSGTLSRLVHLEGIEINALCDVELERAEKGQATLVRAGLPKADLYSTLDGYKVLCDRDDIDLVYVITDWEHHAEIALYAMEHGKHVAIEVPAAMNLQEIWALVNTAEKTRRHCMQLENCVYDRFELTTLNMAQHGLFGEVLHVEGSYIHNLNHVWPRYWNDWRMEYNRTHRGDNYPTHGLGPVCQVLNIHRGDRMTYLTTMDSEPFGFKEYLKEKRNQEAEDFQSGDHTMTMIRTEKGKTIHIQHDVINPRPYSRMYQVTGTKGFANKYPFQGYAFDFRSNDQVKVKPEYEKISSHNFIPERIQEDLMQEYKHPFYTEMEAKARKVGGHGGMDYILNARLIHCLRNGLPLDMDVYDLAEWCSLTELSRLSLEHNSAPVLVPDFTRGDWNKLDGLKFAK